MASLSTRFDYKRLLFQIGFGSLAVEDTKKAMLSARRLCSLAEILALHNEGEK